MNVKFVIGLFFILFCQSSFAEMCPPVSDIKQHKLIGWRVFDSEDDTPLSAQRALNFEKNVTAFTMAEWTKAKKQGGTIHCYYRDEDGSNMEAYLAKDNYVPKNSQENWYKVTGSLQCAGNAEKCQFEGMPVTQRLARN